MLIVTSLGGMLRTETKWISYSLNFDSVAGLDFTVLHLNLGHHI